MHRNAKSITDGHQPDTLSLRVSHSALEPFCDQILHRCVFKCELRVHPFELGVLRLKFSVALQIRGVHATVFRFPFVVGRIGYAMFATHLFDLHARTPVTQRLIAKSIILRTYQSTPNEVSGSSFRFEITFCYVLSDDSNTKQLNPAENIHR